MSHFRAPGDGWVRCRCGLIHWGLHGAAGILVVHEEQALLQKRAGWSHMGGTWALPGGARMPGETAAEAALREAHEEVGLNQDEVVLHAEHTDDHVDWSYTTVVGVVQDAPELSLNAESEQVAWVALDQIDRMDLHPGFRSSLSSVLGLLRKPEQG